MEPCETKISTSPSLTKGGTEKIAHSQTEVDNPCFEGERLSYLLTTVGKEIELERCKNKVLPDKLWLKQQFAIGVNEVTRLLERKHSVTKRYIGGTYPVNLQAVLVASDCNPRWLTKHVYTLAASRNVTVIHIKDKKEGSLRLGELVKLKTAISIGVKVKGSSINRVIQEIISEDGEISGKEKPVSLPSTE